jgi:polysaccharide export outer membrane protein
LLLSSSLPGALAVLPLILMVKEYNSQKFTVEGSVREPGVYPIKGQTTLLQAIASAKGLGNLADASSVYMFRQINGRKYAARFDLNKIRSGKLPDPTLRTKDIVYVEESGSKRVFEYLKPFLSPASVFIRFI